MSEVRRNPYLCLVRTKTDTALYGYLSASRDKDADRLFDRLESEFLSPLIKATIARELRRGHPSTQGELFAQNEAFRDVFLIARGGIAQRLVALRENFQSSLQSGIFEGETIEHLSAYVITVARHACVDYLRQKYPGRHALDVSLRAVLEASPVLDIWRHPLETELDEWRCGPAIWRGEGKPVAGLRFDEVLQNRLRRELHGLERAPALARVFEIVTCPVRYTELLDFLAMLWDVEADYRAAQRESVPFVAGKPYQAGLQPEEVASYIGALQSVWQQLRALSAMQAASLLLKMPPVPAGSALSDLVRLRIAAWEELSMVTNLPIELLQEVSSRLPLDDEEIGQHLGGSAQEVRRIRQDARRRLERRREKSSD